MPDASRQFTASPPAAVKVPPGQFRLSGWVLLPVVCAAEILLHLSLLRLPYFWDEGGYYIPCAWDFFRFGTLIPVSTMRNAHPPLPAVLLAGWWKLAGFHILSTRLFLCLVTSVALLAVYRLSREIVGQAAALAVLTMTAIYPVWFAQSALAHADMFAAAGTLWALVFYLRPPSRDGTGTSDRRWIAVAGCFTLAVLSKETAIVTPAALFCVELVARLRRGQATTPAGAPRPEDGHVAALVGLGFPVLPLALWYLYHRVKTGFMFGNPEYLRYNATANLSAARVLLSLWHRLIHLTVHMDLFVPVLLTLTALLLPARPDVPRLTRATLVRLSAVLAVHWIAFSVLGGALLTRYLLPAFPVLLLLCVATWQRRVQVWWPLAALSLGGFAVACEVNPPYPFAPEDNLAYRDMIVLHQHAVSYVEQHFPAATVLTAWPVAADLQRPELGYAAHPMRTEQVESFTAEEVAKAAEKPGDFDTALVFSTKYNPPPDGLNLSAEPTANDARYFDAHRDLFPREIARRLGGTVVWEEERKGQWAAVLRFPRSYDARLEKQGVFRDRSAERVP